MEISDYTHYVVYFSTINTISQTSITMLLHFTTTEVKYLTTFTALFFYTEYSHYAYFTTIKMESLTTLTPYFTSVLLKWYIWLPSLPCFSSLTTLTTLFHFHYDYNVISEYVHYTVLFYYY